MPHQLGVGLDRVDLGSLLVTEVGVSRTALALARAFLATRQRPMDGRFCLVHLTARGDPAATA